MTEENIYIKKARELAISKHTKNDYRFHVSVVVECALDLSRKMNADLEIVEIAALLHDIGRAKGVKPSESQKSLHHIASAEITKKFLSEEGYEEEKLNKVIACILAHRGNRDDFIPNTIEEKIVANADAMAHFKSFLDLYRNFVEDEGIERGTELIAEKMDRNWNKKLSLPEAKDLVKDEYEAIKLLIEDLRKSY